MTTKEEAQKALAEVLELCNQLHDIIEYGKECGKSYGDFDYEDVESLIRAVTNKRGCECEGLPEKLPVKVSVGVANFHEGVATRLVLEKIKRHAEYRKKEGM